MKQNIKGVMDQKLPSRIIGIQFSILSPDEIRKGSVAEITSRDTYINNKPVVNGLFDPRMGVLEPGFICPTDGLDYIQTPGYFGHIELARPLFYIHYLSTILKVSRSVCIKCSKLLISKEKYKYFLNLKSEHRSKKVFTLANKIKRCGEDTTDGCGCTQPTKIKKEGLATLLAQWPQEDGDDGESREDLIITLTPELLLKCFSRISDEDIEFMGFSPLWSRPEWMICQVLAVPPPAVRPSIKHDSQQRSEDDVSHIIVNIIKSNKTLQEKIQNDAPINIITDWTTVLQYYVATLIDNKIPGVAAVAQRSGRPLKSIKERLSGKQGRVRGNLMGKRVDYSARSVITPDPNLSIRELGIPIKIAKNITKPVRVNNLNKKFLEKLVLNGPEEHPGAKILEKKNGDNISLRYVDRNSIELNDGDIVHRHMMDGDFVLFNRQPTLHRMSMMGHIAKIMKVGDTFRMNVADTKPYNADFDGDEMNLHMPQDIESETELRHLAAIPWHIISPANNKSIIGIFQDSLLGSYRFTRKNINFTHRQAMNLLMSYDKVNIDILKNRDNITSFNLLSQILPPLTMKYKTKRYDDDDNEDYKTSNNVLEIENGKYIRGQLEKGTLGDGTKGILQRICNDFGNLQSSHFVDDLQNIITDYMKTSGFSVGISDLIADKNTNDNIIKIITQKKIEVKNLIDETHIGIFENNTGKTNEELFETNINNILNKASNDAGKIGRESLSKDNRFVIMINAGSKGSEINISQMISCLGQQNVDGKRIPYGFENRTLPHFTKYNDTPNARGFVESSFIAGLKPAELFFHAMGGRVGLIDTAVKTSQTGYIQRRLIKGLEDIKVEYDMTVRNHQNKIIQYSYGDDGFDTVKVENQIIPILNMNLEDIYTHFNIPNDLKFTDKIYTTTYTSDTIKRLKNQNKELLIKTKSVTDLIIENRDKILKNVFNNKENNRIHLPVSFNNIINNIQKQLNINSNSMVDITPTEAYIIIDNGFNTLNKLHYNKPNILFKIMYYYYLSTKYLLVNKRFNKKSIMILIENIVLTYKKSIIAPGEMVGMIAAQSIGEPTTQMTLNTFHFAGVASKSNVTRGLPRIEEVLSLSENPKNPSCTISLFKEQENNREHTKNIINKLEYTKFNQIIKSIQVCFDPDDKNTLIKQDEQLILKYINFENMIDDCNNIEEETDNKSKWIVRIELDNEEMFDRNISMDDVHHSIKNVYDDDVNCIYSDYNSDKLIFRIRLNNSILKNNKNKQKPLDQTDHIHYINKFKNELLNNLILRGVKNIKKVLPRKITDNLYKVNGSYVKKEAWVLDTIGSNLIDLLSLDYIDVNRTFTNDINEIYRTLGIEAARQSIMNEITEVIEFDSTYINYHHLSILCDRMTNSEKIISIFRHGINNDNIGPIAKASFEETPEMFLKAARHAELDNMRGVSANVMCGQEGYFGTNAFSVVLDMQKINSFDNVELKQNDENYINDNLKNIDTSDTCSINNIKILNNIDNINIDNLGKLDDDYELDF